MATAIRSHWLNSPEGHFNPESRFGKRGDWSKPEVADLQGEEMLFMMPKAKLCVHLCCWGWGTKAVPGESQGQWSLVDCQSMG